MVLQGTLIDPEASFTIGAFVDESECGELVNQSFT